MTKEISEAVIRAGLVGTETLAEIRRWGLPLEVDENAVEHAESADDALDLLRDALESEDLVTIRDTDLDIMRVYLRKQERGRLVIKGSPIPVSFCRLITGEYAIPWMSESITDTMVDGETHLKVRRKKVYFCDIREVYFGETKVFMVCRPGVKEEQDG